MKGYKAFNGDLTCRNMQYEIGVTYEMEDKPVCCSKGFHFCKNIADVYNFYDMSDDTRICEVSAIGEIVTDDDIKYCTNKIKIIREIKNKGIKHCNVDKTDVGYFNSGSFNSGDYNSGSYNSGRCNSGSYNSGRCNSGSYNSGSFNSGSYNSGSYNSGRCNSGSFNSGRCNSGDYNSGSYNSGSFNSGRCNSGSYNSGSFNSGSYNSGSFNSGDYNSGSYNSGRCNSGYFNTINAKVRLFNHETDMKFADSRIFRLKHILSTMPQSYTYSDFISTSNMSDEEKERHPEYETIGGYIKTIKVEADKWKWWNEEVSEEDKEFIKLLPYYDEEVFFESTGIKNKESSKNG